MAGKKMKVEAQSQTIGETVLPNGVRLSCAAVLWFSQLQFYYDGRRQLQPLVRLRTDNRRSDPSRNRSDRSTHRTRPLHRGSVAGWDDARIHREAAPPGSLGDLH